MIPRLSQSSVSFKANQSVRDAYDSLMIKNSQTAQNQNRAITNITPNSNVVNQIPMQGAGQKLDIIA